MFIQKTSAVKHLSVVSSPVILPPRSTSQQKSTNIFFTAKIHFSFTRAIKNLAPVEAFPQPTKIPIHASEKRWEFSFNPLSISRRSDSLTPDSSTDEIATFAQKNCLNVGTLQKTRDYVYLKLDREYLTKIFNKIKEKNPEVQMPNFHGNIGPHISIIYYNEWKGVPPERISEIGMKYLFTPIRVDVIQTDKLEKLWIMVVKPSAELTAFRSRYAVGDLPYGYEFHITMAQEPTF